MVAVLVLLMAALVAADESGMDLSAPIESDGISVSWKHCDRNYVCPRGTTCCRSHCGTWGCCPFSMGQCCRDGRHCCRHGYHCSVSSTHCLRGWMKLPASPEPATKTIQKAQYLSETVQCGENVSCSGGKLCCKTADGQWGCCGGGMEM